MTKKRLAEMIEGEGNYRAVRIDAQGNVSGVVIDEPSRYNAKSNSGGRKLIGYDTELIAALAESGKLSKDEANGYSY